jgi:hypothetical protein
MKNLVRDWSGIIIHHSDTVDDFGRNDWAGIRRYHMSWRYRGETITADAAQALIASGIPGVEAPWHDIGYHFGIESVGEHLIVQVGRPLFEAGAHCIGKNETHLGVCCVGDFDQAEPSPAVYQAAASLCVNLMEQFPKITLESIEPHHNYAPKTCPGNQFYMSKLLNLIREHTKNGGM